MSKASLKIMVLNNQKDNRQSIDRVVNLIDKKIVEIKAKAEKS
mgnify:FL=1